MQTEAMNGGRSSRHSSRAALVFLLLSAVTMWAPATSNAQAPVPEEVTVPTDIEAWYYIADDSIEPPAPLPPAPLPVPDPVNPYGEDTLHVSITSGEEDARTYITLDLSGLPATFELVDGILTLPIDPSGVTMNPDTARVQVCLSEIPPQSEEGSFEEPPEVDCSTKAPASYEEQPSPHLVADITDLDADLTFSGLAIMPSDRAREQSDTWHVTFYGKKNEAEGAEPITAELTFVESEPVFDFDTGDDDDGFGSTAPDFGSGDPGAFDFDTSMGPSFDVGSAGDEAVVDEPTDTATPLEAVEELEFASDEARPSYNVVWALPLLLFAFASYFSSALTRTIDLRR